MTVVKEPAREAFLYQIWQKRDFQNRDLFTIDGQKIEIREKGTRNYDSGPDFLNALIFFNNQLCRGDIEVHPLAGDWFAHGHHRDPAYNNVILHIVSMTCPATFRTIKQNGQLVPTLNLDSFLENSAEALEEQEKLNPVIAESSPCALSCKSHPDIQKILEKAGDARFNMRVRQFEEQRFTDSWEQIFYRSVMEALGYSKNQVPFMTLAKNISVESLYEYIWNDPKEIAVSKCEAFLLGAAGLLPFQSINSRQTVDVEIVRYINNIERLWKDSPYFCKVTPMKAEEWKFFRLRPQNFPTRRIAAAAALIVAFMDDGFMQKFIHIFKSHEKHIFSIIKELERVFLVKASAFWSSHYDFQETGCDINNQNIIGLERARDIIINVVLPCLYACSKEMCDWRLGNQVMEIYAQYPSITENEVTKWMFNRICLQTIKGRIHYGVRAQQGLIHLYRFFCNKSSCDVCLGTDDFSVLMNQAAGKE